MAVIERLGRGVSFTWLGHATFLIDTGRQRLLVDPWVENNPACPADLKNPGRVDTILVTHGHFDHAGEVPSLARSTHAVRVVACFELATWFTRRGVEGCVDMNKGGTIDAGGIGVTMTSADHSCGITEDDGSIAYGGEAAGYVIECEGGLRVYHAGDTNVFGDMALIQRLYRPDLALLPIGGHYTMGPKEAAVAAELLGVRAVVPMHHGTFPILQGSPDALRREIASLGLDVEVIALEPGDRLT